MVNCYQIYTIQYNNACHAYLRRAPWRVSFWSLKKHSGKDELILFTKAPLPVTDQIRLLQGRGMVIADEERATRVLQNINYYRLRAYWLPFETLPTDAEHALRLGTDFDNVVEFRVFDPKLRVLFLGI